MKPGSMDGEDFGLDVGSVLLGKYRIESILGRGGMGVVARATHLHLDEPVAIKFLRREAAKDREASRRFIREAQAAVKLKSEHVARVIDVGTMEGDIPYLVMEFLEGVDLDQMIEQSGRIDPPLAVEFMLQGCAALAEAHGLGIIHRDIKPSNFFVTWRSDGSALVKVLDFGISKIQTQISEMSLTQTQSVLGTPAYMSPEQMRSARGVDVRSDIWSIGTVLYELCQGHRPFEAESFSEMCVKVAVDAPAEITVPMPGGLRETIVRCLQKDPAQRYASVGELAQALAPFARDLRQAHLLVERILRTLGRQVSPMVLREQSSSMIPVPRPQTPPPSSPSWPVHESSWPTGEGSWPSTTSTGEVTPAQLTQDTLSESAATRGPRRVWLIALVAALTVAAGFAAVALLSSGDTAAAKQPPAPPASGTAPATEPAMVPPAPPPAPTTPPAPAPAAPEIEMEPAQAAPAAPSTEPTPRKRTRRREPARRHTAPRPDRDTIDSDVFGTRK